MTTRLAILLALLPTFGAAQDGPATHPSPQTPAQAAGHPTAPQFTRAAVHAMTPELVPLGPATHVAARSGDWSDPATWLDGEVPTGGTAWIVPGRTVRYDVRADCTLAAVLVEGTLAFADDRPTRLTVDTLIVRGTLDVTVPDPAIRAEVVFAPVGPLDPAKLGRGLIAESGSVVRIAGADVTDWAALAPAVRGDRSITLAEAPTGWRPGDRLVLTPDAYTGPDARPRHEVVSIEAVEGRTVTLTAPLQFSHLPPTPADLPGEPLTCHVGHLSRNVIFRSADLSAIDRRGHVMVMTVAVSIRNAAFVDLGRSDAAFEPSDANPRGRYPLHFHRVRNFGEPIRISGVVVEGGPKWGLVNHSSHVEVADSVVFNVVGSGFHSEAGDEQGWFRDCLAVHLPGVPGLKPDGYRIRDLIPDYGFNGHGIWCQSNAVGTSGNVIAGAASYALVYYPTDLEKQGIDPGSIPIAECRANAIYASRRGLRLYRTEPPEPHRIEGLTVWGCRYDAFGVDYSHNVAVSGGRFLGTDPTATAVYLDSGRNFAFVGNHVLGYGTGLVAGYGGQDNRIAGNTLRNRVDVLIEKDVNGVNPLAGVRRVEIAGNAMAGGGVVMAWPAKPPPPQLGWTLLTPEEIRVDGRWAYYDQQGPDAVISGTGIVGVDGLTNRQAWAKYGVANAGVVGP